MKWDETENPCLVTTGGGGAGGEALTRARLLGDCSASRAQSTCARSVMEITWVRGFASRCPSTQNKSGSLFGKWGALSWTVTGLFGQANTGLFLRHIWTDAFSLLHLSSHIWSFILSPEPAKHPVPLLTTKNRFYLLWRLVWPWF